jgi:hypothetical protein
MANEADFFRSGTEGVQRLDSIEVEIAQRFFDGAIFRFLQSFGEFAREDILF